MPLCIYEHEALGRRQVKTYRHMFQKTLDWRAGNLQLVKTYFSAQVIAVPDPFFVKKSDTKTYGLGRYQVEFLIRDAKGYAVS
ncbi:MAG TPA: hypothetical protein VNS32_04885 [Flavisolibacter sp.]|nr:hypothetical protein [Flavisolibacter sp.]